MQNSEPLSIRQLEVFVALVDQKSFTRAAKSLRLSQSTVSGHVADLERRLGVRLVERDRGGVRATSAGEALIRPARETLQAERNARMAVEELTGLLRGTLVIGGSTIPASYLLPPIFAKFHGKHPKVRIRLVTGDSREILQRVLDADVELGVVGAPPEGEELQSRPCGEDSLVLIVPPAHPLAGKRGVGAGDLLGYPMVLREEGSGSRRAAVEAISKALGAKEVGRLQVACEVGSSEAVKAAVREGMGIAFVSSLAVRDEVERKQLVEVPVRGVEIRRRFHLISRADAFLSPAARAFREIA